MKYFLKVQISKQQTTEQCLTLVNLIQNRQKVLVLTEAYLGPCQTSMTEVFWEYS